MKDNRATVQQQLSSLAKASLLLIEYDVYRRKRRLIDHKFNQVKINKKQYISLKQFRKISGIKKTG